MPPISFHHHDQTILLKAFFLLRPGDEEADADLLNRPENGMESLLLSLVHGPLVLKVETAGVRAVKHRWELSGRNGWRYIGRSYRVR